MRDSRESHQNLYMSSGDHDSLMAVHPAAAHPHSLAWLMRIIKPTSVTPHRHCQDSVIYCTESRSTGTHSPASSAVSHQWCVVSLSVTVHSEKRKKGNRVTDRAPFCVIQDGFNLRLSRVIICESKRERCKAFAVLPSRWLAWQAANVHLRHKPAPLFEILETQTQGFI